MTSWRLLVVKVVISDSLVELLVEHLENAIARSPYKQGLLRKRQVKF